MCGVARAVPRSVARSTVCVRRCAFGGFNAPESLIENKAVGARLQNCFFLINAPGD